MYSLDRHVYKTASSTEPSASRSMPEAAEDNSEEEFYGISPHSELYNLDLTFPAERESDIAGVQPQPVHLAVPFQANEPWDQHDHDDPRAISDSEGDELNGGRRRREVDCNAEDKDQHELDHSEHIVTKAENPQQRSNDGHLLTRTKGYLDIMAITLIHIYRELRLIKQKHQKHEGDLDQIHHLVRSKQHREGE